MDHLCFGIAHWHADLNLRCDYGGFRDCRVMLLRVVGVGACFVAFKVSRPNFCFLS